MPVRVRTRAVNGRWISILQALLAWIQRAKAIASTGDLPHIAAGSRGAVCPDSG